MPAPEPVAPVVAPAPMKRPKRATETARTHRIPWAELLQKVFEIDVLACPECGGRMELIAFITEARAAKQILDHLGEDSTGPPMARAQAQPEQLDPGPDYAAQDITYQD